MYIYTCVCVCVYIYTYMLLCLFVCVLCCLYSGSSASLLFSSAVDTQNIVYMSNVHCVFTCLWLRCGVWAVQCCCWWEIFTRAWSFLEVLLPKIFLFARIYWITHTCWAIATDKIGRIELAGVPRGATRPSYYCAPLVCVPKVSGGLAVWQLGCL